MLSPYDVENPNDFSVTAEQPAASRDNDRRLSDVPGVNTPEGRTDLANSRRFVEMFREQARFCHPWRKWLIWDSTRWAVDNDGAILRIAKSVADSIWASASIFRDRDALQWAAKSASDGGIRAMLNLAASDLPVAVEEMDSNPWLLNCPNGTVDLRTGKLREHRRDDYLTKLCPTEYRPDAEAPTWERFQHDICNGDFDLVEHKQRLLGYCLTGNVSEQVLPICHGFGSNGKSTEIDAVSEVLGGDYCGTLPRSLLMITQGERHPTELTTLHGKRLVVAHETADGGRLSEDLVKQLTGGDAITARGMRQDFWTFKPTHKMLLLTNHRPRVRGTDHAIWRRLRLIPYDVRFDGDRRDRDMPAKLRNEATGILAWMVQGCLEWQRIGLAEPEAVMVATEAYRSSEDILSAFIAERCLTGMPQYRVKASSIYAAYQEWCTASGERAVSQRIFGSTLSERGYEKIHSNGTWYAGIGLIDS